MKPISFKRHRFPADIIRHAVWLYFRFNLSFRDVEALLAQRGIEVSYETVRCWTIKFGPLIARRLRKRRWAPSPRWHLDEMVCRIGGKRMSWSSAGGTQRPQPCYSDACCTTSRSSPRASQRTGWPPAARRSISSNRGTSTGRSGSARTIGLSAPTFRSDDDLISRSTLRRFRADAATAWAVALA